jgi:2-deoxy-D-gluconate 3-dehydrogenase
VKSAVKARGSSCTTYECDLSEKEVDYDQLISQICHKDGREIDILVNCAGLSHRSPAIDFPDERWDEIFQVNVKGTFLLSRALAKHWFQTSLANGPLKIAKKVINVASVLSFTGSFGVAAYTSSKGAVAQLTKALSNEWMSKGICVTALAPGYIATEMTSGYNPDTLKLILARTPAGRMGWPEEMAGPIVYLASPARYVQKFSRLPWQLRFNREPRLKIVVATL